MTKMHRAVSISLAIIIIWVARPVGALLHFESVLEQAATTNTPSQQIRRILRSADKPILPQLQPTDSLVEVVSIGSPMLGVEDAPGKRLETLTRFRNLVAVIQVTDIASEITPDGTWITSRVGSKILDVWKANPGATNQFVSGGRFEFLAQGGTVKIGHQTIKAYRTWAKPLQEGGQYLVFGDLYNGEMRVPAEDIYEVSGSRFRLHQFERNGQNDIERDTRATLKARVKAVKPTRD